MSQPLLNVRLGRSLQQQINDAKSSPLIPQFINSNQVKNLFQEEAPTKDGPAKIAGRFSTTYDSLMSKIAVVQVPDMGRLDIQLKPIMTIVKASGSTAKSPLKIIPRPVLQVLSRSGEPKKSEAAEQIVTKESQFLLQDIHKDIQSTLKKYDGIVSDYQINKMRNDSRQNSIVKSPCSSVKKSPQRNTQEDFVYEKFETFSSKNDEKPTQIDFQNNQMRTLKDQQALLMMMFENNTEQEQEMIKANQSQLEQAWNDHKNTIIQQLQSTDDQVAQMRQMSISQKIQKLSLVKKQKRPLQFEEETKSEQSRSLAVSQQFISPIKQSSPHNMNLPISLSQPTTKRQGSNAFFIDSDMKPYINQESDVHPFSIEQETPKMSSYYMKKNQMKSKSQIDEDVTAKDSKSTKSAMHIFTKKKPIIEIKLKSKIKRQMSQTVDVIIARKKEHELSTVTSLDQQLKMTRQHQSEYSDGSNRHNNSGYAKIHAKKPNVKTNMTPPPSQKLNVKANMTPPPPSQSFATLQHVIKPSTFQQYSQTKIKEKADFNDRNLVWKEQIQSKIRLQQELKSKQEMQACTFKPNMKLKAKTPLLQVNSQSQILKADSTSSDLNKDLKEIVIILDEFQEFKQYIVNNLSSMKKTM